MPEDSIHNPQPRQHGPANLDSDPPPQDGLFGQMVPYRNPQALIAYYMGVFGLIPILGVVLGPGALVLGILGLKYSKQHPTARGMGHAITGIVLGIIDTLINFVIVVGILLMVATG